MLSGCRCLPHAATDYHCIRYDVCCTKLMDYFAVRSMQTLRILNVYHATSSSAATMSNADLLHNADWIVAWQHRLLPARGAFAATAGCQARWVLL
jgi:hypothetical protein